MQDLKYALRNLWKSRGFAAVAVLTLAIGVGANTAVFSIIDTILLRPLPFRNPDQLVRLFETEAAPGTYPLAGPDIDDWRKQNHSFQDIAMFGWLHDLNASQDGRADHIRGVPTEVNFFDLLGVQPLLGRTWAADEGQPGKDRVVVLSYTFWQSRFAGDPAVTGKTMDLDARKYTIVGVMPPSFRYPSQAQLWIPQQMVHNDFPRGTHWANAIGRLKPGVTVAKAQSDLIVIAAGLEKQYPDSNYKVSARAFSLREFMVKDSRSSLVMMVWAVALVLLIACANVANLLLSRAVARQKGNGCAQCPGSGAKPADPPIVDGEHPARPGRRGRGAATRLDHCRRLLAFQELCAAAIQRHPTERHHHGVRFRLGPGYRTSVWPYARGASFQSRSARRVERGRRQFGQPVAPALGASNVLVVGEIALSLMLLTGAGMLLKDFVRLRNVEVGVRADGVWTGAVQLPEASYEVQTQTNQFAQALLEKLQRIPGGGCRGPHRSSAPGGRRQWVHQTAWQAFAAQERAPRRDAFRLARLLPCHGYPLDRRTSLHRRGLRTFASHGCATRTDAEKQGEDSSGADQ